MDPHLVERVVPGIVGTFAAFFIMRDTWVRRIAFVLPGIGLSFYGSGYVGAFFKMPEGLAGCLISLFCMALAAKIINTFDQLDFHAMLRHRFPKWFP